MVVLWWRQVKNTTVSAEKDMLCINPQLTQAVFVHTEDAKDAPRIHQATEVGLLREVGTSVDTQQEGDELIQFSGFQRGLISCGVFGFLLLRHAPKRSCLWWSSRLEDRWWVVCNYFWKTHAYKTTQVCGLPLNTLVDATPHDFDVVSGDFREKELVIWSEVNRFSVGMLLFHYIQQSQENNGFWNFLQRFVRSRQCRQLGKATLR